MCGIVGYIGRKRAAPLVTEGLKRLEYRGYDSCGIATLANGRLRIRKDVGRIAEIQGMFEELGGRAGIGHTRWATHGNVSRKNAHPHSDCSEKIAVVHNGIISNYVELRNELSKKGHVFKSDTDTECIAHLIEENYDNDMEKALRSSLRRIDGTYAIAVVSAHAPDTVLCARNESPLVLGVADGEMFIGSDIAAFLKFTKKAVPLDDGEYAVLSEHGYEVKHSKTGKTLKKKVLEVSWSDEAAEKGGYEHFMLKEIFEQPQAIRNAIHVYPSDIKKLAEMIKNSERVYLAAAGTSLHAAMTAEYWFSQLCGKIVMAVDSSELANRGVVDGKTLVIGITQSGETYDTLAAMRSAKQKKAKIAAIVNVIGSTATRLANHVVLQGSGIEVSVCATKTFTSQLTILLRTALRLAEMRGRNVEKLRRELEESPSYIEKILRSNEEIKRVVSRYFNVKNYIYIGKGINLPSALEGALKLKEITYNHAEGMSGGMLKHGTISLIDENMHTVAVIPAKGENRAKMLSNIQEVKARGGVVIGIASGKAVEQCNVNIIAQECDEMISPLVFAPIYQLLAYHAAVKLKRDVDRPRALAKSVTVE